MTPTTHDRPASVSSPAESGLTSFLERFGWLLPVLAAVVVYHVSLNNFFSFDDFIWLDRSRTFKENWLQMFRVDVTYFDPVVHLLFLADSMLGGLDPRWYHLVDLAVHAVNAVLVFRFARLLSGETKSAVYAGVLFAASFAIADAVLWSSSRVDLLATFFSLCALIQFLHYLRGDRRRNLVLCFLAFVLALGSKGTPLVLPVVFFWLGVQERKPLRHALCLAPFGVLVLLYVILLKLNMHQASLPLDRLHFNVKNLAMAFSSFFMTEETLKYVNLPAVAASLFLVVTALSFLAAPFRESVAIRRTGWFMLVMSLLPVLVVTDFKLLTEYSDPYLLLSSPSHRIYLASVGLALFGAGLLGQMERLLGKISVRGASIAVAVVLLGAVVANALLVRERDKVWQWVGDRYRYAFAGLSAYRQKMPPGSQLGLIFFPGSSGFQNPMVRVALNTGDVSLIKVVKLGFMEDREVLQKAEQSYLFILEEDGKVLDRTEMFRRLLLLNRMALQHPEHPEYVSECKEIGRSIYDSFD